MTQTTEPTAARIRAKIYYQLHGEFFSLETANEEVTRVANSIAAEIDALKAEVARLRPAAEAWEAMEELRKAVNGDERPSTIMRLSETAETAAARARETAKGQK